MNWHLAMLFSTSVLNRQPKRGPSAANDYVDDGNDEDESKHGSSGGGNAGSENVKHITNPTSQLHTKEEPW